MSVCGREPMGYSSNIISDSQSVEQFMPQAVVATLARHEIVAHDLRIEQADLDDAFIALTTHQLAS